MNVTERREHILNFINERKEITFAELRQQMPEVSEMTLRRDLEHLNQQNRIIRVLGGAKSVDYLMLTSEDAFTKRSSIRAEGKAIIARKAVQLLRPDSTIFLGSGSTTMQLAKAIPNGRYHIITTGLNCAMELSALEDVSILMLGGSVNKNSYCVNGSVAAQMLDDMSFHIAFLGVSGFTPGRGFSTSVIEDYVLRQKIVERSERTAILMDSGKVGGKGIYHFAALSEVDYVISDGELPPEVVAEMTAAGITVL